MQKHPTGFTLIELLIGLAVSITLILSAVPSMNKYHARQELKLYLAEATNFIQSARQMAATTECTSRVHLNPVASGTNVRAEVIRSSEWKGCEIWFQRSGQGAGSVVVIQSSIIENMGLQSTTVLEFDGVSGGISASSQRAFSVSNKNAQATLTLNGIGNGVISYDN